MAQPKPLEIALKIIEKIMIKPLEIALKIIEKKERHEHEDEAHRLIGIDTGEEQKDFLICTITQDGKVLIPGRDDE